MLILRLLKTLSILLLFTIIWAYVFFKIFFSLSQVSWDSMLNSFYDDEILLVDKITYKFKDYKRGDVIVAHVWELDWKEFFLKRIIWIPWDKVKLIKWKVYIQTKYSNNFIKLEEGCLDKYSSDNTYVLWESNKWFEHIYSVPSWTYFLMWDNRNNSLDSRNCFWTNCYATGKIQFINKSDITWKVVYSLGYHDSLDLISIWTGNMQWILPMRWVDIMSDWEYKELKL